MSFKLKLLFFLFISILGNCADKFIAFTGNYANLEIGKNWSPVDNQVYILNNRNPYSTYTLYIRNYNTTSGHSPTIQIFGTSDSTVTDFSNNTTKWNQMFINCIDKNSAGAFITISANTTNRCPIFVDNSFMIAFKFISDGALSGSPDTFDLVIDANFIPTNNTNFVQGLTPRNYGVGSNEYPILISGLDGTGSATKRALLTDSSGNLNVNATLSNLTANQSVNLTQLNGVAVSNIANPLPVNVTLFGSAGTNMGQQSVSNSLPVVMPTTGINYTDPCADPSQAKSSAVINLSSATTTQLVAISGSTVVYVCGFIFSMVGATETLQFEYGTGSSCGTGTTVLTGAIADGTASDIVPEYGGGSMTVFKTIAAQALCVVSTGTVSIQGVVTYVQK